MIQENQMALRTPLCMAGLWLLGVLTLMGCTVGDIQVQDPWARPAPRGDNSAVYFTITNRTSTGLDLIGVESDIAEGVELHRSMKEQDVMKMVKQEAITIPPMGEVIFKPGGYHVMLISLNQALSIGQSFQLTLRFEGQADIALQVLVEEQ